MSNITKFKNTPRLWTTKSGFSLVGVKIEGVANSSKFLVKLLSKKSEVSMGIDPEDAIILGEAFLKAGLEKSQFSNHEILAILNRVEKSCTESSQPNS